MATLYDDSTALRETIEFALSIADEKQNYLIAALLADCLDQLDRMHGPARAR
jgi:hypothetical protein